MCRRVVLLASLLVVASSACAPWDIVQILPSFEDRDDGSLAATLYVFSSEDPQSAPRGATIDFAGQTAELDAFDKSVGISLTGNGQATLRVETITPAEVLEVERVDLAFHNGAETRAATITNLAHGIVVTDAETGDVVESPLPRNRRLVFESDREGLKSLTANAGDVPLDDEDGDDVTRVVTTLRDEDAVVVTTNADAVFECTEFASCFGGDIPRSQPFAIAP